MKLDYDIREKLVGGRDFKAPDMARHVLNASKEKELVELALEKELILSNRAFWVVVHCNEQNPDRIKPFYSKLISNLKNTNLHPGVVRSTLGLFQKNKVPAKHESFLLDKCLGFITNSGEAIAVRAFAITVAFNISKPYPELIEELKMILMHLAPNEEGGAMKARIKNTLKYINNLNSGKSK